MYQERRRALRAWYTDILITFTLHLHCYFNYILQSSVWMIFEFDLYAQRFDWCLRCVYECIVRCLCMCSNKPSSGLWIISCKGFNPGLLCKALIWTMLMIFILHAYNKYSWLLSAIKQGFHVWCLCKGTEAFKYSDTQHVMDCILVVNDIWFDA